VQGAGAALIVPQILATCTTLKGTAHARAISLYGGIGGVAFIVGQMGGGWLVSADIAGLGWRNAFLSTCRFACWCWPEPPLRAGNPSRNASRIDWQGTLAGAMLCCLLFPMALGPELHWPWPLRRCCSRLFPLLWMRASALRKEQRGEHPLMPPRLLKLAASALGGDCDALFQRLVRLYVLYGADHASRSGHGAVAVRQQFYRPRRDLFSFGLVCAEADCPPQHQHNSADRSGDPD
jgi:MFS family permease